MILKIKLGHCGKRSWDVDTVIMQQMECVDNNAADNSTLYSNQPMVLRSLKTYYKQFPHALLTF